jgi:DNA invertase Pin-like site-specific DNA recombinase
MKAENKFAASYARTACVSASRLLDQHVGNGLLAKAHGYVVPLDYRIDDVGSGIDVDRPGLRRLLRLAHEGGAFTRLYVTEATRLLRTPQMTDLLHLLNRLDIAGVEVFFVDRQEDLR